MTLTEQGGSARDNARRQSGGPGWTGIHSWTFLAIVAVGLAVIIFQNRYHYLNPQGLGKAYRIDKVFGSIQEFDPVNGWIKAQLQGPPPQMGPLSGLAEPQPGAPNRAVPMNMPGGQSGTMVGPTPGASGGPAEEDDAAEDLPKPAQPARTPTPQPTPAVKEEPAPKEQPVPEPTRDEKFKAFMSAFPEYGEDEFQLANDDLYPDWRKRVGDRGTWKDFLKAYGEFIQWYIANESPQESGAKLWKDFWAKKGR
jgi:hypothetical protein